MLVDIFTYAVVLKFFVLSLMVLFSIFPNHKADAFLPPEHSCSSMLDCILQYILDGFHKWDAVYFHFISLNGYIYENTLAFFPLYPLVVSILSKTGYLFSYFWSPWVHNILVGVLFSSTCHIFGTLQMYKLSKLMQMGEQIAITSAVLFAINPASVFFSTLYSEAFYSFLLLSALVYLAEGRHVIACFLLSLTTACRSNGIVNCGFACYVHLVLLMKEISDLRTQQISKCWYLMRITETIFYRIFVFIVIIGASIFPYVIFQNYAGYLYCTTEPKPSSLNFLFPSYPSQELADYAAELRVLTPYTVNATVHAEWCSGVPWTSYSLLQRQFWNVGAFRYFQLKQIPNFILAAPVLILAFNTVRLFYSRAPKAFLTLGFLAESDKTLLILPHIYHLIFLSLYGIITVHIQVLTRMLFSSCPVLYWYCASVLMDDQRDIFTRNARNRKLRPNSGILIQGLDDMHHVAASNYYPPWSSQRYLLGYFYLYIFVGSVLHTNFLPWT